MDEIKVILDGDIPDFSDIPNPNDKWNAHITKVNNLNGLSVAGCISPRLGISQGYLIVIFTPKTTREDIIQNWGKIVERREKIAAFYGEFKNSELYRRQTAYRLHNDYKLGYGEIAQFLNVELLVYLCIGLGIVGDSNESKKLYGNALYEDYLLSFGFSQKDVEEYREMAIQRFDNKECPWGLSTGPLDIAMIRESVRSFTVIIKKNEVTLDRSKDLMSDFYRFWDERNYVIELLLCTFIDEKRKIKNKMKKWMNLRIQMGRDTLTNLKEDLYKPPNMGDLDQFFP